MLTLVRLRRDEKDGRRLFPDVLARIERFSERHGGNAKALVDHLWQLYATASPALGLWAIVSEDGALAGHLLAQLQLWDSEYVGWVTQAEIDTPHRAMQAVWDDALRELGAWKDELNASPLAKSQGLAIRRLLLSTTREQLRAWERRAGFHYYRTLMERPI